MKTLILLALALSLIGCSRGGIDGKQGQQGPAGPKGDTGGSCSVSQLPDMSGALILCTDGTSVVVTNGQDATPVTMVKLCPNITEGYPEYAFSIGGKLYAVYSANGNASLALLTPGSYTTTAPGQNCSFVVE